jgi:HAD superfamily hydrolase (TIGR01509 family)
MKENLKSKIRCVIYDCDGVLFDSIETNRKFYNHICAAIGRALLTGEELEYVHMHTVQESVHFLFQGKPTGEEMAIALISTLNPNDFIPFMKMEPNLLQTLTLLKRRGIFRAINTNRTTSMKFVMDAFALWPYFEMVVTALDVKNPKPHAESVTKILDAFHLQREEAVFVGDSQIDRQTADAADIRFIAYKNPDINDGWLINDHLELLDFLA